MPINRSLDDLTSHAGSSGAASGWSPDDPPRWAPLLAQKWHRENMAAGVRPHAVEGTRFRHSDAGGCARKIAYKAAGFEATNPMDVTGSWNTRLGTLIHDAWQEALVEAYPHAEIELTSQVFDDGSGSMDALVRTHDDGIRQWVDDEDGVGGPGAGKVISIELKTQGGSPFKYAIGKARRGTPPEGPKSEHVIQGALNALAHNADELVIAYLAKETLSQNYDDVPDLSKFCAEWTLTREQYEPIARLEIERVEGILALLDDEGLLAARKAPAFPGEIVDLPRSRWEKRDQTGNLVDTGSVWGGSYCSGYCSHYDLCVQTPSGRVPVERVVEISKGNG